jgi:hypothetical protein
MNDKKEIKEDFCPSCLVVPLAFAGAGAAAAGGTVSKKHKIWKKALLISGVISVIISIGILIYFYMNKDCKSCKLN